MNDSNDAISADTPETIMITRARLEPVPPPEGPAIMTMITGDSRHTSRSGTAFFSLC